MAAEVPPPLQLVHSIFSSFNSGLRSPRSPQPPRQQQQEFQHVQPIPEEEEEEEEEEVQQQQEEEQEQQEAEDEEVFLQQQEEELKYLEFVQFATVQALMRCAILYSIGKDGAGPLKPGVESLEEAVKMVVAPVYNKFHLVPSEFLRYVDRKVDESIAEIDRHVPTNVKKVSSQARSVVSEVRRAGVVESASGLARTVYDRYEPKAEQCAASAWRRLNQLPLFPRLAGVVLPRAAYCTEKYNEAVVLSATKGYRVSAYLPLVPTEKISKVFSAAN